jgi:hypothetical protein
VCALRVFHGDDRRTRILVPWRMSCCSCLLDDVAFPKGTEDYRPKLQISAWVMYLLKEFPVSLQ